MRDVAEAFAALPRREDLLRNIPDPARFRPEPRIVARPELRVRPDGQTEMLLPAGGTPRPLHPMVAEATRALLDGDTFDGIVARATPLWEGRTEKIVDRVLRTYMLELQSAGIVEIPFEQPPDVFHGRFERIKVLGRGGMGIAHLCRDRAREGRLVVVKHAWGWGTRIEKAERVSRREAIALSLTDHPLIPGLVDTFEVGGLLHIAREFAAGKPLLSLSKILPEMPAATRLRIARDMLDSMRHIHERGMLYLDVKLDNYVLSSDDGRARLLDLGLCRPYTGEPEKLRIPIGSRGYVSPEVLEQRIATPRSDVYGVGRALYILYTGEKPRQKWDAAELATRLRARHVSEREVALVTTMCAQRPEDRPASLVEPMAEIDALLTENAHAPAA